ncbi:MAG: RagB/SusD family nutrient uptake outer membrane protein [Bacteroidales bacterium]|nr:RagB/SusD family nutrient uptake outer membrane protein [Bacteroidales bacterium]
MKTFYKVLAICSAVTLFACDKFIDVQPKGVISEDLAMSQPEEMVTAAYARLGDDWYTYPFNLWPYGDLSSDDSYKGGSGTTDTNYHAVEVWSNLTASTPDHMDELWYHLYCAVSRCNRALVSLRDFGAEKLGEETAKVREAEVRFLRAHFYFKLIQLWYQVPWVDEEVYENHTEEQTKNNAFTHAELMEKIVADFKFAYDNLPETQAEGGRANKIAAAAYLTKCYLTMAWGDGYEASTGVSHINNEYMQQVLTYSEVVEKSSYGYLEDYGDIFLPEYKNSKESIFAVQHSNYEDDNTRFGRANWSNMLNGCWGIWSCGWDFHKPSQNLVNAFKTVNGLPMLEDFNDETAYPVNGVPNAQKWDPRLFHTVGMPTFPYKYEAAYTMTKDNSRNPSTYGYYASLKEVPQRSKGEAYDNPWQAFPMNDYVLRYTDIMLMRAEALIETGSLEDARSIVNDIRQRAKNSVSKHIGYAADQCEIALYSANDFSTKEKARARLQMERRLELAMENGRFFDLRRWGIASTTLNNFFAKEQFCEYEGQAYAAYYKDAHFTPAKNEYFPLPYIQLYYVPGLYTQNKNYN